MIGITALVASLLVGAPFPQLPGPSAGGVGRWNAPMNWEVIAIHAAMLPTGEVLHYSYPLDDDGSRARTWNPTTGVFTNVDWPDNLFCSGLSQLPDGKLYVVGGTGQACEAQGILATNQFDPVSRTWTALEQMRAGRWYPTNVTLPDGRIMLTSGRNDLCEQNGHMELYTPGKGLELVEEGHAYLPLFPRMHVLTSGKVAFLGPAVYTFEFGTGWQFVTQSNFGYRDEGASVLIPGRTDEVLVIGGLNPLTNTCEIIDLGASSPAFRYTAPLNHARGHADALILPDKTIMLVGGGRKEFYSQPVLVPELFDPETETWRDLAPHVFSRMYHATTLLLPDARVLVAGQDSGASRFFGEVYDPPYLNRGPRPTIATAPQRIGYDRVFTIGTPEAESIDSVVLVKLSTVTHSVNFDQRLVELPYAVAGGETLAVTGPPTPSHAPPGYYMLFVLDGDGVPSPAAMIRLAPGVAGDVNGDGVVDFADILVVLGGWGPCPPSPSACPGDANGDGTVDFGDVLTVLGNWS